MISPGMLDGRTPTAFTRGRTWPTAAVVFGLAALVLFMLRAVLSPGNDVLPGRDSINLYIWEIYTRAALASGQLPFWNPFHFAGTPHLADVQTTVLYPPALLLRWLPPEAFFSWMAALHVWLGGVGVLFLARVIGLGWWASAAAALAGMLGGATGARLHNGHLLLIYCTAWLPWALGFAIVSLRRPSVLPHPALVLVLVLQFLAGYIQGSIYLVSTVCLFYVFGVVWPEPGGRERSRHHALGQLTVVGLLSLGVAAFQLFPTARLVIQAARLAGLPYEDAIEGGWSLDRLASFFFPFYGLTSNNTHRELAEASAYVSFVLMASVPLAFFDRAHRRIAVFLGMITCIALALVSVDLPFYRLHHMLFPAFRFPGRVLFLATVSLAVLGALGFERLVSLAGAQRWRTLMVGLTPTAVGIVAGILVMISGGVNSLRPPAPAWPWLSIISAAGLIVAGALASCDRARFALMLGLAAVAIDISAFTSGALAPVSIEPAVLLRRWMGPPMAGRAISTCENRVGAGEMLRNRQASLDGLAGIIMADYADWAAVVTSGNPLPNDGQFHGVDSEGGFPARRDLLDAANVSTIYSCMPLDVPSLTLISRADEIYVYRNASVRSRAFWTCGGSMMSKAAATARILASRFSPEGRLEPRAYVNVRWVDNLALDRRRSLEQRHQLEEGVAIDERTWRYTLADPSAASVMSLVRDADVEDTHGVDRGTGLVTGAPTPAGADEGSVGDVMVTGTTECTASGAVDVTLQDQLDGHVEATVQASSPGYVFLSEPFFHERRAFVDGQQVTAVKADLAFTAVPVPAGTHRLELRYVPDSFSLGLGVSVFTLVVWAGASWRRKRTR